jgi:hypothetical protein
MAYVQRDGGGNITGVFANPQPGHATEFVADNDASITAFLAKASVPQVVSAMQAKVALLNAGLLSSVQTWINAQDATTQLVWNSATTFSRQSTLIAQAATALGLSSAQIDTLFVAAAAINP